VSLYFSRGVSAVQRGCCRPSRCRFLFWAVNKRVIHRSSFSIPPLPLFVSHHLVVFHALSMPNEHFVNARPPKRNDFPSSHRSSSTQYSKYHWMLFTAQYMWRLMHPHKTITIQFWLALQSIIEALITKSVLQCSAPPCYTLTPSQDHRVSN
jgi:hypothetical protein